MGLFLKKRVEMPDKMILGNTVSYTHLTLPTKLEV